MSVRDVISRAARTLGSCAAIAAKQHGLDYQVLEQGVLVNSIFRFPPQMVFFTTPELLEIGGLPFVSAVRQADQGGTLKYYRKVVDTYDLQISDDEQCCPIAGKATTGSGRIRIRLGDANGKGVRRVRHARLRVMAIGYYDHPVG